MRKNQLPTPSLIINQEVLEKNIRVMASLAKEVGVQLRPHIKTHKNVRIAKMQIEHGAIGVTCATVSEAELMVAGGIDDVFIAYPLLGDYQLTKAAELNKKCNLKVAFDSSLAAERWSRFGEEHKTEFNLIMIINTGGNRDGILPEEALGLAMTIKDLPHIKLMGVMTHEGYMHRQTEAAPMLKAAKLAAEQLVFAAESLRRAGFEIEAVSSGSSPACQGKIKVPGITEWRPGTYVFNDFNEMKFVVNEDDVALRVVATVVSNPSPGRYIVDAGSKVLSEGSRPDFGHGFMPFAPEARIIKVNEEHGIIEAQPGALQLGQRVEIIPIHVCTVVNLSNGYYFEKTDGSLEYASIDARGLVW